MNQGGGLQRLARRVQRHFVCRQLAQFLVNERQQFGGGFGIALLNAVKDASYVTHAASIGPRTRDCEIEKTGLRANASQQFQFRLKR